jgi:hypothetical protein
LGNFVLLIAMMSYLLSRFFGSFSTRMASETFFWLWMNRPGARIVGDGASRA